MAVKKIKNKIKTIALSGLVAAVLASPIKSNVNAQEVHGSIGYLHTGDKENSCVELNTFYQLPANVNAHTFLDFYRAGGYFGKTSLCKDIKNGFGPRAELVHCDKPLLETRLGVNLNLDLPKKSSLSLRFLPLTYEDEEINSDNMSLGYFFNVPLPKEFCFSSFGEWDFKEDGGPGWTYGEARLSKKVTDKINVELNAALSNEKPGDPTPEAVYRMGIRFNF